MVVWMYVCTRMYVWMRIACMRMYVRMIVNGWVDNDVWVYEDGCIDV